MVRVGLTVEAEKVVLEGKNFQIAVQRGGNAASMFGTLIAVETGCIYFIFASLLWGRLRKFETSSPRYVTVWNLAPPLQSNPAYDPECKICLL